MKKWLFGILIFNMNAFASDSLIDEWNFIHPSYGFTPFISFEEPAILIEKLESEKNEFKKEVLKTILELNLQNLEKFLNFSIKECIEAIKSRKESIDKSNNADDIKRNLKNIESNEKAIVNNERSLEIISEWREKYLSNPR